MKNITWLLLFSSLAMNLRAAEGDTLSVKWQLYIDWYYKQNANIKNSSEAPKFLYNYRVSGQPALNLGLANVELQKGRLQAKLGVMAGDYVEYNLPDENNYARLFYQANIGYQLSSKHNLWAEAGIFPAHIGAETAIGFDHHNLSRTMAADNSPYYETGARLYWKSHSGKYYINALVLNGWQTSQLKEKNPSWGFQFTWNPVNYFSFNYSNYFEKNKESNFRLQRVFQNFFITSRLSPTVDMIGGFDLGYDRYRFQNARWYTVYTTLKWSLFKTGAVGARMEYFNDPQNVIILNRNASEIMSSSFNIDKSLEEWGKLRFEVRWFNATRHAFEGKKSLFMYTLGFCARLGN